MCNSEHVNFPESMNTLPEMFHYGEACSFELDKKIITITMRCCTTADKWEESLGCLHYSITWQGSFCSWDMCPRSQVRTGQTCHLVDNWPKSIISPTASAMTILHHRLPVSYLVCRIPLLWQIPEQTFEKWRARWKQNAQIYRENASVKMMLQEFKETNLVTRLLFVVFSLTMFPYIFTAPCFQMIIWKLFFKVLKLIISK